MFSNFFCLGLHTPPSYPVQYLNYACPQRALIEPAPTVPSYFFPISAVVMAELAVIMSMITVTSTAATILGAIKRRCGASLAIVELAGKSDDLVNKIRELLKTLEDGAQVPYDTRGISTALNHRREEFDAVLKNLEKMNRRTKRTHPADRTEKFIMAQGWAKKMEAIHAELVEMRSGVENIVSIWDVAKLVTKDEEIVTVDATKKRGSGESAERWKQHSEIEITGSRSVTVDQCLMTMVKLNDANKEALNRYGRLGVLSLPDALFEASMFVSGTDEKCEIELLQRAAELLHPRANYRIGFGYKHGLGVKKDLDLAVSHFQVASSGGDINSMISLISHFDRDNESQSALKYIKMASGVTMDWLHWFVFVRYQMAYSFESTELVQPVLCANQAEYALQQSVCHFFGLGVPKSNQKALDALQAFDFTSFGTGLEVAVSNLLVTDWVPVVISRYLFRSTNQNYGKIFGNYADFLFNENQFLPFLLFSRSNATYSRRKFIRNALHLANSDCVDAHIFLAEHYSLNYSKNEREIKRHLRIAADAGHFDAQSAYRQLFGGRARAPKGVSLTEQREDGKQRGERNQSSAKTSETNKEDLHRKRTLRF